MTDTTVSAVAADDLAAELAALTERLAAAEERLAAVEASIRAHHLDEDLPEDVVLAISAACAAFLGTRAKVKQVRLRRGRGWAASGRAGIQKSHAVSVL